MESSDLGYNIYDNFAPVGLSAGNAASSSATDDSVALVESLPDTFNKLMLMQMPLLRPKKATWGRKMTILKAVPPVLTTRIIKTDEKLNQISQLVF